MTENLNIEDGNYIKIHNRIIEELAKIQLTGHETRVMYAILRKTYGWNKKEDYISYKQFEQLTELKRSDISKAITKLIVKNIVVKRGTSRRLIYRFNKYFGKWNIVVKKRTLEKTGQKENSLLSKTELVVVKNDNKKPCNVASDNKIQAPKDTLTKDTLTKGRKSTPFLSNFALLRITEKELNDLGNEFGILTVKKAARKYDCYIASKGIKLKNNKMGLMGWLLEDKERSKNSE